MTTRRVLWLLVGAALFGVEVAAVRHGRTLIGFVALACLWIVATREIALLVDRHRTRP